MIEPQTLRLSDLGEAQRPPCLSAEVWAKILRDHGDVVLGVYEYKVVEITGPAGRRRVLFPNFHPNHKGMTKVGDAIRALGPLETEDEEEEEFAPTPVPFDEQDPDWWKNQ